MSLPGQSGGAGDTPAAPASRRWKALCAYDGGGYCGWQSQSGGQPSVQQAIEEALEAVFKRPARVVGSGRTDAGAHALEQVFHFDAAWSHGSERLSKALYRHLPRDIRIFAIAEAEAGFHARHSALGKRYAYRLHCGTADPFAWPYCWSVPERLDPAPVSEAMAQLVGRRDFAAYAANRGHRYETTVRHLWRASLESDGPRRWNLVFEADGFMYKMVRSLAGALVNVGLRRLPPEAPRAFLLSGERSPMVFVAPARGLFLEKVFYA